MITISVYYDLWLAVQGNLVQKAVWIIKFWLRWQRQKLIDRMFLWAVRKRYHEYVFLALEMGADTNARYPGGNSALHLAVCQNNWHLLLLLIQLFPYLNITNRHGWTPLRCAYEGGQEEMYRYLVDHGAVA